MAMNPRTPCCRVSIDTCAQIESAPINVARDKWKLIMGLRSRSSVGGVCGSALLVVAACKPCNVGFCSWEFSWRAGWCARSR